VPSARAHATLIASTPSSGQVVARAPSHVTLRFDEQVETAFGSIRVYDGSAQRVDEGGTTHPKPDEIAVGLRSGLPQGTYTVSWRVVSGDSHPISSDFVFHIGEPAADESGVADQVLDGQDGSRAVGAAFGVVRFLELALILLCVGGVSALAFVLGTAGGRVRRALWVALALAAASLAAFAVAGIGLQGAKASGLGLDAAFRPSLVGDVMETQFGRVWLVRAGLAIALAVTAVLAAWRIRTRDAEFVIAASGFALLIALTPAISGHAKVQGGIAILSDWAHVLAAGVWTGGLAFLLIALAVSAGRRWELAAVAVPRFSAIAVVSVAIVIASGVLNGIIETDSLRLWEATYGRLLLLKVGLVVPLLALGAFNNRFSVPRLGSGTASGRERRRFVIATVCELAIVVVIVAVTAALIAEPPTKAVSSAGASPGLRGAAVGP
jgi:copper transport protein